MIVYDFCWTGHKVWYLHYFMPQETKSKASNEQFAERLRQLRMQKGISQKDFAHQIAKIGVLPFLDATVRQQAENNKLQAELNGAVVQMALSTVKQLAESAVRPVVPGKSATEVFGEGAGQTIG